MKRLLIVLAVITLVYVGYVLKYQQLLNEGTEIANQQCTDVNPLIFHRKKLYVDTMQILTASGSTKTYWDKTDQFLIVSKQYIAAQKAWLVKEKAYIHRWDFKVFAPSYIQHMAQLQYDSREADMKAQIILDQMLGRFYLTGEDTGEQQMGEVTELTAKRDKADKEMEELWKEHQGKFEVRTFFITVPTNECSNQKYVF
jgi:hypothetical protein